MPRVPPTPNRWDQDCQRAWTYCAACATRAASASFLGLYCLTASSSAAEPPKYKHARGCVSSMVPTDGDTASESNRARIGTAISELNDATQVRQSAGSSARSSVSDERKPF